MTTGASDVLADLYHSDWGRIVATLIRLLGDFDLAEEAAQEAFATAAARWTTGGIPEHPRAWIIQTGRNAAIDRLRETAWMIGDQPNRAAPLEMHREHFAVDANAVALENNARSRLEFLPGMHQRFPFSASWELVVGSYFLISATAVATLFIASVARMMMLPAARSSSVTSNSSRRESAIPSTGYTTRQRLASSEYSTR